jgi:hypothetical protein
MPTVTIPDDTYDLLARKAAAVGVSPGEFIALTLAADTTPTAPHQPLEGEARQKAFDEWMREVAARAHMYPPGFELDVSREAMYPNGERE